MTSRQRGAAWVLAVLVLGRLLDALDLPFEARPDAPPALSPRGASDSTHAAALDSAPRMAPAAAPPGEGVGAPRARDARAGARAGHGDPVAPVRINTAGALDLQALPGVGPVLAQRIVAYREAHGPLRSLSDLRRVRGIGPRACERLAPLVRFD